MLLPRWLTTLIQLRRSDRDQCRQRLDEALQAASVLESKESALARETAESAQLRRDAAGSGTCDLNLLLAAQRHQAALQVERQTIVQQLELLHGEVERRRTALAEAEKQVRALERLSERKEQQARQAESLREAKRLDELATTIWQQMEGNP